MWLQREGLLVPSPGGSGHHGWYRISRRGQQPVRAADVDAYRRIRRQNQLVHRNRDVRPTAVHMSRNNDAEVVRELPQQAHNSLRHFRKSRGVRSNAAVDFGCHSFRSAAGSNAVLRLIVSSQGPEHRAILEIMEGQIRLILT
jgi:hypothetical protein